MSCPARGSVKVKTVFVALAVCALSAVPCPSARERRPPVARDARALRRALASALGGEFGIVRDELTRRSAYHGGGAYWLAHLRPKRPGRFTLKYAYSYEDPFTKEEPRAWRAEHSIAFVVGPRGCRRRQRHFATAFYQPCLGDTVILPVALDAYRRVYAGHAFEFTAHPAGPRQPPPGPEEWERDLTRAEDAKLRRDPVANPAAEHLKYLGSTAAVRPHRSPGYTAEYHATFEAVRPGRFNLLLGLSAPGAAAGACGAAGEAVSEAAGETVSEAAGGVPVIVVERGTPVTWVVAEESVTQSAGRFSSHAGNSYLTTPVIMQPGERLTLRYYQFTRRGLGGDRDGGVGEGHRPPAITLLPFRVNPDESFNEWVVGRLPK